MVAPLRPQAPPGAIQAHLDRLVPAYRVHLNDLGCSPGMVSKLTGTARHMLAWLAVSATDVATLDIRGVGGFLRHDCNCPTAFRTPLNERSRGQAHRFLGYLIETGQATVPPAIVTGGELVDIFTDTLTAQGYSASTMRKYRSCCRHYVVWLYLSDLAPTAIDGAALRRFLDHDCTCTHPHFYARSGGFAGSGDAATMLSKFTDFLVDRGVVADLRDRVSDGNRDAHVDAFLDWLRRHRGLRDATLSNYQHALRAVLPRLGASPGAYDAASIRAAILRGAQSRSRSQIANESTALRSYLRFLTARGMCRPGLAGAVPSIRRQPAAQLPRYVGEGEIEALIASCDTATAVGLRDRAVLLLLARLALRPGDITALRLGDIDWEQAVLAVCGKSRRSATLPLPQEAGDALKDYIVQARPRSASATVFLRSLAPHRSLSNSAVSTLVGRAMKRTGIAGDGLRAACLFRHSRATHLLRGGTSLEAVGALLRHRSVRTTALYARVDVPMLLAVAQPWPEEL